MSQQWISPQHSRGLMYALVLVCGLTVVLTLLHNWRTASHVERVFAPLVDAVAESRILVTRSHVLLEEMILGERSPDTAVLQSRLDSAAGHLGSMIEGGTNKQVLPPDDEGFLSAVKAVQSLVDTLRSLSLMRLDAIHDPTPAAALFNEYHDSYHQMLDLSEQLDADLHRTMKTQMQSFRTTQIVLIAMCILATFTIMLAMRIYHSNRRRDWQTLNELNKRLRDDIDRRRSAEQALRTSEAMFRAITENSADIIIIADANGCCKYVTPSLERLSGFTVDNVLGHPPDRFVHAEDLPLLRGAIARVIESPGEVVRLERLRVRSEEGDWLSIEAVITNQLESPGVEGLVVTCRDISERRRVLDDLRESEHRFRTIGASILDALVMINADGRVEYWNPAAERMFGYKSEETLGRNVHALIMPEEYAARYEAGWRNFKKTGKGRAIGKVLELKGKRRSGEVFPIEIALSVVSWRGEYWSTAVIRDISERKKAEEDLREYAQSLSEAKEAQEDNSQRLVQLIQELEIEKARAEKATQVKSEFLANMSHEIRTPLNGIIGMTDLALDDELSVEQRECLEMLRSSADHLMQLVNDILDFSKFEAGRMELEAIEFSLRDLLASSVEPLVLKAAQKSINLTTMVSPLAPDAVVGDPGRLRQVVINLVGNAVKFTDEGEVAIRVEFQSDSESGNCFHFAISDSGIGIPADKQDNIFESFTQADGSTTREYGGTGLGTTISRQLVRMMDGHIWVESPTNQSGVGGPGATLHFTVRLGLADGQVAMPDTRDSLQAGRALVIDEATDRRNHLAALLENWGMDVTGEKDLLSARPILDQTPRNECGFDVIIVDEAALEGRWKEDGAGPADLQGVGTTPIILMVSGYGGSESLKNVGAAARMTLRKPLNPKKLQGALRQLLSSGGAETNEPYLHAGSRERDPEAGDEMSYRSGPGRILIAEDNPVNMKLAQRLLAKRGYDVMSVTDGRAAVDAVSKYTFDAVLMDVQMPVLSGLEATAEIRRLPDRAASIPVIAMTANAMVGDREECLRAGMNDYVSKPIEPIDLYRVLEQHIGKNANNDVAEDAIMKREGQTVTVFNRDRALAAADGDAELVVELLTMFRESSKEMIRAIEEAIKSASAGELKVAAHTLKGSLGNLGAAAAADVAQRLETMGLDGDLAGATEALERLVEEVDRFERSATASMEAGA